MKDVDGEKGEFLDQETLMNIVRCDRSYSNRAHNFISNPPVNLKLVKTIQKQNFKHQQAKNVYGLKQLCRSFFAPFWRGGFRL